MRTENLSTLKIHKLTQEQYKRELAAGRIDPNAIYLTPDEAVDFSGYATVEELNNKADANHTHDGSIKDAREKNKTMISFTDDDCKTESYTKLFNEVIQEMDIPYTFACPVGSIDDTNNSNGYITLSQLKTMYDAGVTYSCHLINEGNMESFATAEALDAELKICMDTFNSWGINDVKAYAYCNGIVVDDYINVIKKYFDIGMTVKNGINKVPYETYFMNRVEVFSNKSAIETVSEEVTYVNKEGNTVTETVEIPVDAKSYVDQLLIDGGWLIFMTHAWYTYYNSNQLLGLVKYIKSKEIEIVGLDEGIKLTGNIIDTGLFKKPIESATEPYFVLDSNGEVWSNTIHDASLPEGIENVKLELQHGYMLDPSTGKKTKTSDTGYKVTQFVDISGYDAVLITGWAYEGWNVYSFFDAGGLYLGEGYTAVTTYADGGDTFNRVLVEIPEGAKQILIAGNIYQTLPALTKLKADRLTVTKETVTVNYVKSYKLSATTGKIFNTSDSKYVVTEDIYASEGEVYELTCSGNYNNALYVIYKADGSIAECLADTTNSLDGTAVSNLVVTMPKGTSYFRVACNEYVQPDGYVVTKVITKINTNKYLPEANGGDADTLDGQHASDFATASDVEDLKTLVGDVAVSEQIGTAVNNLAVLDNSSGCYYRITNGEVEWINPPMLSGVEYRTTKRIQGVPVYTKLIRGSVNPGENAPMQLSGAVDVIASIKATTGVGVYYDIFDIPVSDHLVITDSVLNNDWTVNIECGSSVGKPIKFIATFEYTKE